MTKKRKNFDKQVREEIDELFDIEKKPAPLELPDHQDKATPKAGGPILVIKNLHKRYNEGKRNEVHALRGIDLTINKGDMMAIMGPSGCGKTTLLNMIGHLDRNSGGKVIIDGIDTGKLSDSEMTAFRRDNIGYIFQLFNLMPFLTAVENVETPLLLQGVPPGVAREEAKMILRDLGMGDRLYHYPRELSGGQQQRVAVARSLITKPAIILGDEPTGDLDSTTANSIMRLFRRININQKQTLILVTHNRFIADKCDYIIHIRDGKITKKTVPKDSKYNNQGKTQESALEVTA